jgi:hypothetical protein
LGAALEFSASGRGEGVLNCVVLEGEVALWLEGEVAL